MNRIVRLATDGLQLQSDTKHLATHLAFAYLESQASPDRLRLVRPVAKAAVLLAAKMRERDLNIPTV